VVNGQLEHDALAYIRRIDDMGGMLHAVEAGYPQGRSPTAPTNSERQVNAR